jgi:hypothetical protein
VGHDGFGGAPECWSFRRPTERTHRVRVYDPSRRVIEIEEPGRRLGEVWVSRKDPATVLPWADGVLMEPAPDGGVADSGVADGGRQTRVESMFRILPAW